MTTFRSHGHPRWRACHRSLANSTSTGVFSTLVCWTNQLRAPWRTTWQISTSSLLAPLTNLTQVATVTPSGVGASRSGGMRVTTSYARYRSSMQSFKSRARDDKPSNFGLKQARISLRRPAQLRPDTLIWNDPSRVLSRGEVRLVGAYR